MRIYLNSHFGNMEYLLSDQSCVVKAECLTCQMQSYELI